MIEVPRVDGIDNRANVLFLFSDQHNARCLGSEGHPDVKTPHLDRLASEGVRFTNAYTQNPICTPSRMSYLSGLYPSTHGYYGLYGREPDTRMPSMFSWFHQHGYRTGALGKLHTPRYWVERSCQYVYDEFIQHPSYLEGAGLYEQNDNRGFHPNAAASGPSNLPLEHSCEWVLVKHLKRYLRQETEPSDRCRHPAPWMAWVSFARPHQPYTPSEPFASMYSAEDIHLPATSECGSPALRPPNDLDEAKLRQRVSSYLGCVSQVDAAIGLVYDELERRGELDRTIIVYASDHGDHAGEHGRYEKKSGISARSICRVPMIVRFPPRVVAGAVRDQVVEAVDLFPTLCELAGLPIPKAVQGRSMLPLLGDEPRAIREDALTENMYRKALATQRYRYVANLDGESDELYDVQEDPWELQNLVDNADYCELVAELQRRLLRRLAEARRPITAFRGLWLGHRYDEGGRLDPESLGDRLPYD